MKAASRMGLFSVAFLLGSAAAVTEDRTITKVVKLLERMLEDSKAAGDSDRKIYAKFLCYCNEKKETKTKEIDELTQSISLLEDEIAELKGSSGKLSVELAQLKADKASNRDQVAAATALRMSEAAAFSALELDLTTAIGQMNEAVSTLAEVGADQTLGAAADHKQFMAPEPEALVALRKKITQALTSASAFLPQKQAHSLQSFVQAPFTGTYTAQSGEVVGILKQMRDTFEANLESARSTEAAAQKAFDELIAAKEKEYEELSALETEKQEQLSSNDASLATKKEQLATAQDDKAVREDFLAQLIPMCTTRAEEYAHRNTMRANEDAAISEAIAILNKDSAFETFGKVSATSTGGTAFLQYASVKLHAGAASPRVQVQHLLQKAAKSQHSLRLIKIVALLEAGNPFTAVLEAIDKLIVLIGEEGKADLTNLDWCNSERTTSDQTVSELSAQIVALQLEISTLNIAIEAPETGLKDQIASTEVSLSENYSNQKTSTEQRQTENQAYQADVANLVEATSLLESAIHVLGKYYAKVEAGVAAGAPLEAAKVLPGEEEAHAETFEEGAYTGQSGAGKEVLTMLGYILQNTKDEETAAHTEENTSQHDFEDAMQTLKDEEAALQQTLAELKLTLAEKEKALAEAEAELKKTQVDKDAVEKYLVEIKPGCDFITDNIGHRDTRRASESTALEEAKGLLKETPVYQAAVAEAHLTSLGVCRDRCVEHGEDHVKCKACLAKVEIPGYCAGHPDTAGCS